MSTLEAATTADAAETSCRPKSNSPRTIPVIGVVTPQEDVQVPLGSAAGAGQGSGAAGARSERGRAGRSLGLCAWRVGWLSSASLSGESSLVTLDLTARSLLVVGFLSVDGFELPSAETCNSLVGRCCCRVRGAELIFLYRVYSWSPVCYYCKYKARILELCWGSSLPCPTRCGGLIGNSCWGFTSLKLRQGLCLLRSHPGALESSLGAAS